jgi:ATP-dependent Clp protease ATP-binding subunit ClpC
MFERYTEKARRAVFFARYEALQYGSQVISPEHILLGLMRGDKTISVRFFPFRSNMSVEAIRREVEERIVLRERMPQSAELHLAPETKRILVYAKEESERLQSRYIGTEHLLLGLMREERSIASEILFDHGLRLQSVREDLMRASGYSNFFAAEHQKKETPHLQEFTRDLTQDAVEGRLDPLVGREKEVERIIEILCRRTKNNPVLIGEAGVGKTAIIEGLAQRIVDGNVPSFLENKRILSLDLSLIVAGTKYRGQFEERLKQIMKELVEHDQYIIFIDEIHTLVGAGSAEGSLDAANILKPALSRGEIQCIGATTPSEFRRSVEKDRALERRFQSIKVMPPNEEEARHGKRRKSARSGTGEFKGIVFRRRGDQRRRRAGNRPLDGHPGNFDQAGRSAKTFADRKRAAPAHHLAASRHQRSGAGDSPLARGTQKSEQTRRLIFIFRRDGRRQNRGRPNARRISVRFRTRADPL